MKRILLPLAGCWFLGLPAVAQVSVDLSLHDGQTAYKIGEPILLDLKFVASEPGLSLNVTTTEPASPIDELVVSPTAGVFPWLEDQARGERYSPDFASLESLQIGMPITIRLPLNGVYRFDAPGHYTVHVVTRRVLRADVANSKPFPPLTSNSITFDIEPMSEAEDAHRAAVLEQKIRAATDLRTAQQCAEELDWLTGDGSTRVKLSLFLHPKSFYPFGVDVSKGLWIARNRPLVVAALQRALSDPEQPMPAGLPLLKLAVSLKARLESPFNPAFPTAPLEAQRIGEEYVTLIADSFEYRKRDALVDAARIVFVELAGKKGGGAGSAFAAARELLIEHFAEVNEFNVDWLLNGYGEYFKDPRIVPALKQILREQSDPRMGLERTAVLGELMKVAPTKSRKELAAEVCADNATLFQIVNYVPFETLPETDDCIKRNVDGAIRHPANAIGLQVATEFAARFASPAIYDDLLALYEESGRDWDKQAQGYILGYFMRWDSGRGLPFLERALPADASSLDFNLLYALDRAYSPALDSFWRERLQIAPPEQAGQAAWLLSEHGPAEDQALIRARLENLRAEWKGRDLPEAEAQLEADLLQAAISGKNWRISVAEAAKLREACLSKACKDMILAGR